jgi:hypothetical protein
MDFFAKERHNAAKASEYRQTRAQDSRPLLRMVMKRILLLIALLAIASCAATSETQVKRGKKGLHINCSGLSSSWDKCYTSAANSCAPKGYKVIAKSGDAVEEPGDYPFGLNPAGYTSRSMIVICK